MEPVEAVPPSCGGWNAPRSSVIALNLPLEKRSETAVLASVHSGVAGAVGHTDACVPRELAVQLGDSWEAGAEAVVEYLSAHGVAVQAGDGDRETVAFLAAPSLIAGRSMWRAGDAHVDAPTARGRLVRAAARPADA